MLRDRPSRRTFLALAGSAALAGCTTGSGTKSSVDTSNETVNKTVPLGESAPEQSWPQVGRDVAHTGYDPTTTSTKPSLAWTQSLKGSMTTPTLVGETVYLTRGVPTDTGPEATLEAYALDSGERRWSEPLDVTFAFHAPHSDSRPVYHRGTLYVVVDDTIVALDAESRERYWEQTYETTRTTDEDGHERTDGHGVNDPVVVTDDAVYACDVLGGALVCLNRDGSERWQFSGESRRSPRLPAVADETVYVATGSALFALDPQTGSEQWRYDGFDAASVVLGDDVIVRSGRDVVEAVELDGTRRWETETFTNGGIRPAVANGRLYVADLDGNAAAFGLDSGEELWGTQVTGDAQPQGTVPVVVDGALLTLHVTDDGVTVTALDAESGEQHWQLARPATRARGPVPSDGTLVFTAEETPEQQRQESTMSAGQDTTSTLYTFSE